MWRGLQHFLADTVIFLYKYVEFQGSMFFENDYVIFETYRSQFSFLTYNLNYSKRWEDKIMTNVDYHTITIRLLNSDMVVKAYWNFKYRKKRLILSVMSENTITICSELIRFYFGYRWSITSLTYWNKDRPTTIIKFKIYSKSINYIYWCEL